MVFKVLLDSPLPPWMLAMLGDTYQLVLWKETNADILETIDGCFVYGHPTLDGSIMDSMPNLKVVSNFGVGVDHIDIEAAQARGIPVGNTPNLLDGATADMALALILATARNMIAADRYARSDSFTAYDPSLLIGSEIHGTTIGIIGLGNVGFQVAKRALAFDMCVLYHNRRPSSKADNQLDTTYVSLDDLLQRADFVVLTVPLTPSTQHIIGARELRLMKPTAFLINVARGGVVDHDALLTALIERQIAGAGLDVTDPEPLPRSHPLLEQHNVVLMPHLGSATTKTRQAMTQRTIDNLAAGLAGEDLITQVA